MSYDNDKRRRLLGRLSRRLACTAPVLALAAGGMSLQATMEAEPLAWGSGDLTSLAAYMVEVQRRFAGETHDL